MCDEGETADQADAVRTESQKMESRAGETALDGSARSIIVLIVVGMLVGVLSGMFGIGGGTVIVPALVWLGLSQRNAAATSMLAIVPTAISGVVSYAAGGNVDWLAAALLFCGMFVGGQVGSWLLSRLPELALRWIFVVFLVFCGGRPGEFRAVTRPPDRHDGGDRCLPGATGCGHRHAGGIAGYWWRRAGGAGVVDSVRRVRPGCARHFAVGNVSEFDHDQRGELEAQASACENRADYWCDGGCDRAARHVDCGGGFATSWGDYVRLLSVRAAGAVRVRGRKGHARGAGCAGLSGAGIFPSGWMI